MEDTNLDKFFQDLITGSETEHLKEANKEMAIKFLNILAKLEEIADKRAAQRINLDDYNFNEQELTPDQVALLEKIKLYQQEKKYEDG